MPRQTCLIITALILYTLPAAADSSLQKKFGDYKNKIEALNQNISALSQEATGLKKDIATLNTEERRLRTKMLQDAEAFDKALRRLIRLQRQPEQALLASDLMAMQTHRKHVVNKSQQAVIENIKNRRQKLEELLEATSQQETKLKALAETQNKLAKKRDRLLGYQTKIIQTMESTPEERRTLKKQAKRLKDASSVTALLNAASIQPTRLTNMQNAGNIPVDGKILRTYHEKNSAGVTSLGLTIETTPGTPIVPWRQGRVIYSDTFRDYGHLVIVEHADGTHALYSGLNAAGAAKVGDLANVGELIGFAPQKPNPIIYLEARKNGKPIDPMRFLEKN